MNVSDERMLAAQYETSGSAVPARSRWSSSRGRRRPRARCSCGARLRRQPDGRALAGGRSFDPASRARRARPRRRRRDRRGRRGRARRRASASASGSTSRSGAPAGHGRAVDRAAGRAQAVPLPDGASLELGAGLGIPALTAHRCLHAAGPIAGATRARRGRRRRRRPRGDRARPLRRRRASPTTVSSEEKARLASAAGAELVVDYRTRGRRGGARARGPPTASARIVEVAIAANLELDAEVIAPGGEIASYGAPAEPLEPAAGADRQERDGPLRARLHDARAGACARRSRRSPRRCGPARSRALPAAALPARADRGGARRRCASTPSARSSSRSPRVRAGAIMSEVSGARDARIGWIGVGRMGSADDRPPARRRLRRDRLEPHAREGRAARASDGATIAAEPAELADCDIVFTMVARLRRPQGRSRSARAAC